MRSMTKDFRSFVIFIMASIGCGAMDAEEIPLPSGAEIEARYSATNRADVLVVRLWPLLNDIGNQKNSYETQMLEQVQFHLMTNIIKCPLGREGLSVVFRDKEKLIQRVSHFEVIRKNYDAFMYLVDYLGTVQPIPVTNQKDECIAAMSADKPLREQLGLTGSIRACGAMGLYRYPLGTPNLDRYLEKWMPIQTYNMKVCPFRISIVDELRDAASHQMRSMNETEKFQFCSNVIERAKLDEREAQLLFR